MKNVDYKKFVRAWQQADSVDEVMEKMSPERKEASGIAGRLRQMGVPLKKMKPKRVQNRTNWDELIRLAEKYNPNGADEEPS